jgi:hypothetical protein
MDALIASETGPHTLYLSLYMSRISSYNYKRIRRSAGFICNSWYRCRVLQFIREASNTIPIDPITKRGTYYTDITTPAKRISFTVYLKHYEVPSQISESTPQTRGQGNQSDRPVLRGWVGLMHHAGDVIAVR